MDNMSNGFVDKELTCKDCKQPFTFTAGEQAFFDQNGFTEPKRCKPCREAKKARQANSEPRQRRAR
jgi:hypothetical protein